MKNSIEWKQNGWIIVQEADAREHVKGIAVLAENGTVTKATLRHGDSEEKKCAVTVNGAPALPCSVEAFRDMLAKGMLSFN